MQAGLEYFSEVRDADPVDGEPRVEEPAGGVPQGVAVGRSSFQVFKSVFQDQSSAKQEAAKDVELSGAAEVDVGKRSVDSWEKQSDSA